jgi:hypothetical protein
MDQPCVLAAGVERGVVRSKSFHQRRSWQGGGLIRSAKSGSWSDAATWVGGKVPGPGTRVQVREDHRVVYDVVADRATRLLHIAGTPVNSETPRGPLSAFFASSDGWHRKDRHQRESFLGTLTGSSQRGAPRPPASNGTPSEWRAPHRVSY